MDRFQFIGQATTGNRITVDDIIQFFDHTMAAYEVVGALDNLRVHGEPDSFSSSLKIFMESPNTSELENVVSYIDNTLHNRKDLYGKTFDIQAKIEGQYVELFVHENSIM